MKRLTASALALSMAATGALAASDGDSAQDKTKANDSMNAQKGQLIRSRDIIDGDIYTSNEAHDEGWDDASYDSVGPNWNEIGEIEDIVLSKDGQMVGVVAEIGGFLDISDKHVMIEVDDLRLVPTDEREYVMLTRRNEEQLEALPSVNEGFWE